MTDQGKENKKDFQVIWIFILFFAVFIIIDIFYIYIAQKTWQGVATEDAYQKGLHYNQTIEYVKKQKNLGWRSQIKYRPIISKTGNLDFLISDQQNLIISDAKVFAIITRPLQSGYDFKIELPFDQKKLIYSSKINFPLKGQWNVEIQAINGSKTYQEVKRLIIQ